MNRRRFLKYSAPIGIAGLAGCTGDGDDGGGDGDGGGTSTVQEEVEIEWWHAMGGNHKEIMDGWVESFNNENDNITVNAVQQGNYQETFTATKSAISAGNPPNIVQLRDTNQRTIIDSGSFVPVEQVVPDGAIDWGDYHQALTSYYSFNDRQWALPFNSSHPIIFYNKDLFEEAGLDPENPPNTYAELREQTGVLVEDSSASNGIVWPSSSWYLEEQIQGQNQVLVNENNGRDDFATEIYLLSDASLRAHKFLSEMAEDGRFLHTGVGGQGGWRAAIDEFYGQNVAMFLDSTASVASRQEAAQESGFELGTTFIPSAEGKRTGAVVGGAALFTAEGMSETERQATGEFLRFISSPERQATWHKQTGYFPTTQTATDQLQSENWFENNPNFATAFEQLQQTEVTPATQGWVVGPSAKVRDLNTQAQEQILTSDRSVEDVLSDTKSDVDEALQNYKSNVS